MKNFGSHHFWRCKFYKYSIKKRVLHFFYFFLVLFSVSKIIWNQFKWKYENIIISLLACVLFYILSNPFLARKGYAVLIFWLEFVGHLKWCLKYEKIDHCLKCLCNQFLFSYDTQYVLCLLNSAIDHILWIISTKYVVQRLSNIFKLEFHWSAEVVEPRNTLNTFTAIIDLSRFNNSCLKSPASTLVDLTFQSRVLRSFSLNQLRNVGCLRQPTLPLSIRINTGSLYRNVSILNYKRDKDNVS